MIFSSLINSLFNEPLKLVLLIVAIVAVVVIVFLYFLFWRKKLKAKLAESCQKRQDKKSEKLKYEQSKNSFTSNVFQNKKEVEKNLESVAKIEIDDNGLNKIINNQAVVSKAATKKEDSKAPKKSKK